MANPRLQLDSPASELDPQVKFGAILSGWANVVLAGGVLVTRKTARSENYFRVRGDPAMTCHRGTNYRSIVLEDL